MGGGILSSALFQLHYLLRITLEDPNDSNDANKTSPDTLNLSIGITIFMTFLCLTTELISSMKSEMLFQNFISSSLCP